ncbi:MAG: hypothetical protein MR283_03990 [Erysipelotrichaceae bacterium]|nr:hypothetical protein [Erysipelotrichaceae bacterium]MDY6035627.1 hypothetical protein [Bulleidia sp.]
MIGIIITGNGRFPEGVSSAMEILSGKPKDFEVVSYLLEETVDEYEARLRSTIEGLKHCGSILIMTDLQDSTTYRSACMLAKEFAAEVNIDVVAGLNIGMVLQTSMARSYITNVNDLASLATETGHSQIVDFDEKSPD